MNFIKSLLFTVLAVWLGLYLVGHVGFWPVLAFVVCLLGAREPLPTSGPKEPLT